MKGKWSNHFPHVGASSTALGEHITWRSKTDHGVVFAFPNDSESKNNQVKPSKIDGVDAGAVGDGMDDVGNVCGVRCGVNGGSGTVVSVGSGRHAPQHRCLVFLRTWELAGSGHICGPWREILMSFYLVYYKGGGVVG